ncbi:MAG: hypothetical protein CVV49_07025 [Spirochaetae bacterium HGW-Spirochaetae-5]|nr:MAG: hypothetical protein CVV49_07025 [Spirochaetae bacterium HGW-Spirochaetae-5]
MPYCRIGASRFYIPLFNPVSVKTLPVVVKQFNIAVGTLSAEIIFRRTGFRWRKIKENIDITDSVTPGS